MVELALLPELHSKRLVIGTSVRKSAAILRYFFASLLWQEWPKNVKPYYVFVDDCVEADASQLLAAFVAENGGEVLPSLPSAALDFTDAHPDAHQWSDTAMHRVGANKDRIIQRARELSADALFFCDSDLILDTTTVKSLWNTPGPISTAVYHTRWSARQVETQRVYAAPQVWLAHPYQLSGAGYEEHEFRAALAGRGLVRVAGYGACTLLQRRALDAGASFAPVPGVPQVGLMAGEDRQFCIRAQRLHLDGWADAWPDIFHIYHPTDIAKAPEYAARLSVPHSARAELGDLVSLTIQPIEPVPWQGGGFTSIPAQHVRGRLGALALQPELEQAVLALARGEHRIVPVHFPIHYEIPFYRGKRRLIRVTLNDCKPHGWAPTLADDMLRGMHSADVTAQQLNGMREVPNA